MKILFAFVVSFLTLTPGDYNSLNYPREKRGNEFYKAYNQTLMHWQIPFHETDIPTGLGTAHVITCGPENGEPLVLLHGMNATSTMWYPNVRALSCKFRIYAIDYLAEPGKSKMTVDIQNLDDIVSWYNEIFEKLNLDTISIVGASKGGWLAVKISTVLNTRVRKLVLLSPLQTFSKIPPDKEISRMLTFPLLPTRKRWYRAMETMSANPDKIEKSFLEQVYLAAKKAKPDKFLLRITPFTDDELKSIKAPVLLLIGDQDIINNEKSLDKAKQVLPDCETEIIEQAGHFLSIDQSQVVNERIISFLQ